MAEAIYDDIDFDELNEITGLEKDEIKVLKICFGMFDVKKQDFLSADDLDDILRAMGFRPSHEELQEILLEIDEDGSGEIEFGEFCQLCAKFLIEEPDEETMKRELKEAFRVYDKEANGFITTDQLREIIAEVDTK
jgi:calmodulin